MLTDILEKMHEDSHKRTFEWLTHIAIKNHNIEERLKSLETNTKENKWKIRYDNLVKVLMDGKIDIALNECKEYVANGWEYDYDDYLKTLLK